MVELSPLTWVILCSERGDGGRRVPRRKRPKRTVGLLLVLGLRRILRVVASFLAHRLLNDSISQLIVLLEVNERRWMALLGDGRRLPRRRNTSFMCQASAVGCFVCPIGSISSGLYRNSNRLNGRFFVIHVKIVIRVNIYSSKPTGGGLLQAWLQEVAGTMHYEA